MKLMKRYEDMAGYNAGQKIHRNLKAMAGALVLSVLASGCLVFNEGPLLGNSPEQGYTECGDFLADPGEDILCPPGRYCEDPTFSECVDGCLSNENCAEDQRCVKADGKQIGSCQAEIKRPASEPRGDRESSRPAGFTTCGEGSDAATCQPGQYCDNAYFSLCDEGCLSDLNCGDEQLCIKEQGENVGTCQRAR